MYMMGIRKNCLPGVSYQVVLRLFWTMYNYVHKVFNHQLIKCLICSFFLYLCCLSFLVKFSNVITLLYLTSRMTNKITPHMVTVNPHSNQ